MKKNKIMSPLIIVGILISAALADVSHVLSGAAHPPVNPSDVNSLSLPKNAFQSGNPNDFWWMASNSPLKEAYEYYKKCSSKGDCLPPVNIVPGVKIAEAHFDPIDLKKNPFLNGEFQAGAAASSSSFSSSSSGCSSCSGGAKPGEVVAFHTGTKIDITNNPFFNGQYATAGNGEQVKNDKGFIGVQPKKPEFAISHPLSNKKPFATSFPNAPQSFVLGGGGAQGQECKGQGYICVRKNLCINGIMNKTEQLLQVKNDVQYCNANTEVCCRLADATFHVVLPNLSSKTSSPSNVNGLVGITAGKSSVTGSSFKFSGGAGLSPGQIQVLVDQSDDVKVYHNGGGGSQSSGSTNKATRDVTLSGNSGFQGTIDYSGVQIPDGIRFESTIKGPAYLPPVGPTTTPDLVVPTQPSIITHQPSFPTTPGPTQTTRLSCPPGTFLTTSGLCETPTTPTPSCPFGTIRTPSGFCEAPIPPCPVGTIRTSAGICESPSTPTPQCPFGTIRTSSGICESPTTPVPQCPFGTIRSPTGICEASIPPCPFGTIRTSSGLCESPSTPTPACPYGTIRTPSGICESPTTPAPACPFGTIRTSSGICEAPTTPVAPCPFGTIRTSSGLCEGPSTPIPECPYGTVRTPSGICESPTSPAPSCPFGTFRTPYGNCERPVISTTPKSCPFGTVLTPDGSCARPSLPPSPTPTPRPCPPGTFLTSSGLCEGPTPTCPFGTVQRPDGSCETFSSTLPPPVCPYGALPDGSCIRPSPPPSPKSCPAGTFLTAFGTCEAPRPPTTPISCPPGTYITTSGLCEASRTPTPRPACPPGTIQSPSGICEQVPSPTYSPSCPPGTILTSSGLCETRVTTARPQCPPGTYLTSSGICESLRPSTPKPPPRPFEPTASRDYLPPVTPTQPSSPGYNYETPTPPFNYPSSTLIPNPDTNHEQYVPAPTTPKYLPPSPDTTGATIEDVYIHKRPSTERPDNRPEPGNVNINVLIPDEPPVGCAAALKCVQEIYCTAEGVVSPVPVVLTKDQELLRVPTTACKDLETGIIGKCCRDPNYKDPWPSANLVNGVDNGQYKEDNLYGQRENAYATNRLTRSSNGTRTNIRRSTEVSRGDQPGCGERHQNSKPLGSGPLEANFAEYPWQAMILRDSNRSLLCGGAIIRRNAVLTAAHCVEGLDTSDVLIKGGEWKLGIDEEPLPFQIVKVGAILRHPDYVPGSYKNDLAVLVLRENLRPSKNVGTICLSNQATSTNCVATGWGKRILQLHAKGAIMNHINVNVMDPQQCQETLSQKFQSAIDNYSPKTLCGVSDIDQCKVDYGSALACANSEGQYTLAGIYSWDTGCKEDGQIGGYVTPDVDWIESTLAKSIKELKKIERGYLLKTRT